MTRRFVGDLFKRKSKLLASQTSRIFFYRKFGIQKDPYDTYDYLMDLSEQINSKSSFYFLSGKKSIYDPDYFLNHRKIKQVMRKINQRGHIIGIHPSYHTYNNNQLWEKEYTRLALISPQVIKSGRQHYLRFAVPHTWQIWEDHNLDHDSSMGYADCVGFRCGICTPFTVFNFLSRQKLKLKEKPLHIMDATLVEYRKLAPEQSKKEILKIIGKVKKYKGTFVILWHNSSFTIPPWDNYQDIYQEILFDH